MKLEIETKNEQETMLIAEKFGKSLFSPCVVSLDGDLGAGKTTFVKGLAKGLGITENITSPTFTILNNYSLENGKNLYHFDLYRLNDTEEFYAMGFEEYFDLTTLKGITVVEWASNCQNIIPARHFLVSIKKGEGNNRTISIIPKGLV